MEDGVDECRSLLNSIDSNVSSIKEGVENIENGLATLPDIFNTILQNQVDISELIKERSKENLDISKGIENLGKIAINNSKFLKENQKSESIMPNDILVAIKNIEAISKGLNKVFLGGS